MLAMLYLFFAYLKDYFANLKITFFSNSIYFIFKLLLLLKYLLQLMIIIFGIISMHVTLIFISLIF